MDQDYISWQAPEFRHYPKNFGWYVTFIALCILIVGYEIFLKDWFGAVSLAVIGLLVGWFAKRQPKIVVINISSKGIGFGDINIPYHLIRHFWVVHNQNHKTLNLETTAYLNKIQIIELMDEDPDMVRDILLQHLTEAPRTEETLAQRVMHRLKF